MYIKQGYDNEQKKLTVTVKIPQVHHLKIKLKKVMRNVSSFKEQLNKFTSRQRSGSSSTCKKAKFQISESQKRILNFEIKRNFLILQKRYNELQKQNSDTIQQVLLLVQAMRAQLSQKLFAQAVKPPLQKKEVDVKKLRNQECYKNFKQMLRNFEEQKGETERTVDIVRRRGRSSFSRVSSE